MWKKDYKNTVLYMCKELEKNIFLAMYDNRQVLLLCIDFSCHLNSYDTCIRTTTENIYCLKSLFL